MLIFYPVLYNGAPATMVNLSNIHFGVYIANELPINLCLNHLTRIKTGANLNQLRIIYESDEKHREPVEICFFNRADRDSFLENLVEAQLVDQAKCCYFYVPAFLLRSCCGLFQYNQLYMRKCAKGPASINTNKKTVNLKGKQRKKAFSSVNNSPSTGCGPSALSLSAPSSPKKLVKITETKSI